MDNGAKKSKNLNSFTKSIVFVVLTIWVVWNGKKREKKETLNIFFKGEKKGKKKKKKRKKELMERYPLVGVLGRESEMRCIDSCSFAFICAVDEKKHLKKKKKRFLCEYLHILQHIRG